MGTRTSSAARFAAQFLVLAGLPLAAAMLARPVAAAPPGAATVNVSGAGQPTSPGRDAAPHAPASTGILYDVIASRNAVVGGTRSTGTVAFAAPIAAGTRVTLRSSNSRAAAVPEAVVVPARSWSVSFPVQTHAVAASANVYITATIGPESKSCLLAVSTHSVAARGYTLSKIENGAVLSHVVPIQATIGVKQSFDASTSLFLDGNDIDERNVWDRPEPDGRFAANYTIDTDGFVNGPHELHVCDSRDRSPADFERRIVIFNNDISDIQYDEMIDNPPKPEGLPHDALFDPLVTLRDETRFVGLPHPDQLRSVFVGSPHTGQGGSDVHITAQLPREERWWIRIRGEKPRVLRTLSGTASRIDAHWDGKDASGNVVAHGAYYFRIFAGGSSSSLKLMSKYR